MRKDYCDKCGEELLERIIHLHAYTEGESVNHDGFGGADYFIKLDLCEPCADIVKQTFLSVKEVVLVQSSTGSANDE